MQIIQQVSVNLGFEGWKMKAPEKERLAKFEGRTLSV